MCNFEERGLVALETNRGTKLEERSGGSSRIMFTPSPPVFCSKHEGAVAYKTPVTCGHCYIGQTGRCFVDRVTVHRMNVKIKDTSFLSMKHLMDSSGC